MKLGGTGSQVHVNGEKVMDLGIGCIQKNISFSSGVKDENHRAIRGYGENMNALRTQFTYFIHLNQDSSDLTLNLLILNHKILILQFAM